MSESASPPAEPATETRRCQNCGEPLLGEHCYACGQPTKGLVRHFGSIIGDFLDSVFEYDSRVLRTIGPLMFRPGALSVEYFAGRRVRYVSPVRLFVFLSLLAFFAAQLAFELPNDGDGTGDGIVTVGANGLKNEVKVDGIRQAGTVAEVEARRDEALADIAKARIEVEQTLGQVPGAAVDVSKGLDAAEQAIGKEAADRIAQITGAEAAGVPVPPAEDDNVLSFNDEPWHPVDNPIDVDWIGEAGNARLNAWAGRAKENIERIQKEPNLLKDAFLSAVPTTLFVLLPLFALMLKIAYLFKKRLYMEHLIVALHSHAFLCGALLGIVVLDAFSTWTAAWPLLSRPLGWLEVALIVWMPIYLLLMQKKVYGQGWIMTLFKYWVLGTLYFFLVMFGALFALMASLVNM